MSDDHRRARVMVLDWRLAASEVTHRLESLACLTTRERAAKLLGELDGGAGLRDRLEELRAATTELAARADRLHPHIDISALYDLLDMLEREYDRLPAEPDLQSIGRSKRRAELIVDRLERAAEPADATAEPRNATSRKRGQRLTPAEERRYRKIISIYASLELPHRAAGNTDRLIEACREAGFDISESEWKRIHDWGRKRGLLD